MKSWPLPGSSLCSGRRKRGGEREKSRSEVRDCRSNEVRLQRLNPRFLPLQSDLLLLQLFYGASINSIFPSRVRWSTINTPLGSRKTNTSLSRKCASLIASSKVMGRRATESRECTRCTSVVRTTEGNLCPSTETVAFSASPNASSRLSSSDWPSNFLTALRFLLSHFVLCFSACFCKWSRA